MPIRMEDDPLDQQESSGDGGGSGGGGGGGFFVLLPILLSLFRGRGLLLLLVIIVGGYFFLGRGGCNFGALQHGGQLATGGILDPAQFAKAKIYEPLADDNDKNPLPKSANLQKFAPSAGDQGQQGSCVAWSSAYGARTIEESIRTGQDPNSLRFSPSFLYNQIGINGCDGSYIQKAMEFMTREGSVAYDRFPYSDRDCSTQPDQVLLEEARQFRMRGFNRLSDGDRTDAIDLRAIRENLAQGAPVVVGMMVGGSYMQPMMGQDVWNPTEEDRGMMGFGGHAQCVVGYDDKKYGGAFLIMNSWGSQWGNNGFAWVRYPDFKFFAREAYGVEPMTKVGAAANAPFECEIGLVKISFDNNHRALAGDYIQLANSDNNIFKTSSLVKPGTKFKIEIKNSTECYIYVFGKETDGTSYTLFPYPNADDPTKTRYSPFCGIAGYRFFPKNKSLVPDSLGAKDIMAIVVSRDSIDWSTLNNQISQHPQQDYGARFKEALGERLIRQVQFDATSKGNIHFKAAGDNGRVITCMVTVNKK